MELPSTHVKKSLIRYTYIHNHCIPELLFLKTVERIMGTTFENQIVKCCEQGYIIWRFPKIIEKRTKGVASTMEN